MRSRRRSTARDSKIGNPGESSYPMAHIAYLGFVVPVSFASGQSGRGASTRFGGVPYVSRRRCSCGGGVPAAEVFLRANGATGVEDEVVAEPFEPLTVPRGIDLGEGSVEVGPDRRRVREVGQRPEVLLEQQLVFHNFDFSGGRSVRQRLEMSGGGTILLEQTVDGLPTTTSTLTAFPDPSVTKKPGRKRRNPHSSRGRSGGGDALGGTSG